MLLNKTNVEESKKILKYLKINELIECKCNLKKNNFILTNNILDQIQYEYKINPEV